MSTLELIKKTSLFWDINASQLSLDKHHQFIIERIIEKGNLDQIIILFKIFSKLEIKQTVLQSKNVSSASKYFWQKILASYE